MCLSLKPFFESWIIYSASFQFLKISEKLMHSLEGWALFTKNKRFLQKSSPAVINIIQHLHNITGNATTRADLCSFVTVMPNLSCLSVCSSAQWFKLLKSQRVKHVESVMAPNLHTPQTLKILQTLHQHWHYSQWWPFRVVYCIAMQERESKILVK